MFFFVFVFVFLILRIWLSEIFISQYVYFITVFATGSGNAMEWFDFGVYAYTTAYIGANFFSPVQNPQIQQIFTFAALAIAFLLRPIGGIVFGIIGDKYGRKVVLTTTIILMALSTLTIGVLPNYDMIGLWAPALLLLARILQ